MTSFPAQTRTSLLRSTAHAFCTALIAPPPPNELLSTYFTHSPSITEHGPSWATARLPFLGKTFAGREACGEYFNVLSGVLEMHLPDDAFPGPAGFIVDAEAGMVSVVGKGHFVSTKTGKGWDEQFIYRLSGFDAEGKIGHWEIWADPLSAWDAVGSEEPNHKRSVE
ncbi:hypothetical protein BU23DRAFT_552542 [Bimuria novae-zelandiae CBS 107.79]|uniref:SnoaL-like domain-containing protein n=1 Tax=Bimuria novae-zelandiae CBS 107.79 TaxID=1447943 RepID=A0A6A5VEI2_9PLEO|nr:hypothetical protein BU23DRAFT_552542 [Bimuria novae-zelandiae CBS 107.79]